MVKETYVEKNALEYFFSNYELFLYSGVCFFIPFLLGHPQWLVGTIVNAGLVLTALNLKGLKVLPPILLPSLAVLARGAIFGPFTPALLYMVPFIWLGNGILVNSFQSFKPSIALFVGALGKAGFLFTSAFLLNKIGLVPPLFLTAMGIMQLYTALSGGLIGLGVQWTKKNTLSTNRSK